MWLHGIFIKFWRKILLIFLTTTNWTIIAIISLQNMDKTFPHRARKTTQYHNIMWQKLLIWGFYVVFFFFFLSFSLFCWNLILCILWQWNFAQSETWLEKSCYALREADVCKMCPRSNPHLHLHLPLRSTHSFPYKYNVYKPLGFCYTVSRDCYVKQTQTDLMSHRRGLPFEEVLQPEYNMGHNWTDCTLPQIPTVMHWTVLRIKIETILESNNC